MIRGTNKRIIEISGEEGSCFERIVLFLRPEQEGEENEGRMLKMAEDYADGLFHSHASASLLKERKRPGFRFASRKAVTALLLAAAAAGAVILCLVLL